MPDVAQDPAPEAMEFDTASKPPRVPQPTSLIINRQTGRIDFALAGIDIPADCAQAPAGLSPAECEFDQYLESLDGYPTVTPARTPATAPLKLDTLTVGTNVVVVAAKSGSVVNDVTVGFDAASRHLTLRPNRSWTVGESYWVGVRGYGQGVRAENGREVVGSPTQFLLKQPTSLTCGAMEPSQVDPSCPAFTLLRQSYPDDQQAAAALLQLEGIRQAFQPGWSLMDSVGGLPRSETAVLWNFSIHTASVAELDPTAGLLPRSTGPDEIRVAVQGTVDPATVDPFIFKVKYGTVVLMDLTAAQSGDALGGFPTVTATYAAGDIVIKGAANFVPGHQYGLFLKRGIHDAAGASLVPSPVSVLLRLRAPLLDEAGHSTISTVSDGDATQLEAGRRQLAMLFDDNAFATFTQVVREELVYCFAFPFVVAP